MGRIPGAVKGRIPCCACVMESAVLADLSSIPPVRQLPGSGDGAGGPDGHGAGSGQRRQTMIEDMQQYIKEIRQMVSPDGWI